MSIADDVKSFINRTSVIGDDIKDVEEMLLEVAKWQATRANENYADFIHTMFPDRTPPSKWKSWTDIIPMPVTAFKSLDVYSGYGGAPAEKTWMSSGTTGTSPSRTYLQDTELYDLVIDKEREFFLPEYKDSIYLLCMPNSLQWPNSSLSYMYTRFVRDQPFTHGVKNVKNGKFELDIPVIVDCLNEAVRDKQPVILLTTSYALVQILDALQEIDLTFQLPEGSVIVDTGGFKGLTRTVPRYKMIEYCGTILGVPSSCCVNEYGMSEMSSQFWTPNYQLFADGVSFANKVPMEDPTAWPIGTWMGPSWVKVRNQDPYTLEEDPNQNLVFYDLANVWSCVALMTEDIGHVHPGSQNYIIPAGRKSKADVKGCSIATERAMDW